MGVGQSDPRDQSNRASSSGNANSAAGDAVRISMPNLRQSNRAGGDVALRLRLLLSGTSAPFLPDLQNLSAGVALLPLQRNREGDTMRTQVTQRDQKLLGILAAARWLTTRQVKALCFPQVTMEMARRRLRILASGGFVHSCRTNRMAEALHSLGHNGRSVLVGRGWIEEIRLERKPPKNIEHFLGINDIRVAVERSAQREEIPLNFFFAYWELLHQGWEFRIIPDAACQFVYQGKELTVLFEYDRGEESPGYIIRTKFKPYAEGLDGLPFSRVLMVVETERRRNQLQQYTAKHLSLDSGMFFFITLEDLNGSWNLTSLIS
ncbi:MAG: replication-relaxation family protein [Acidobacteria bacterium]|nr:replication-relaxation family protein [Acidobacteriota bacterium]